MRPDGRAAVRLTIDSETRRVVHETDGPPVELPLDSPESFALLSDLWLTVGWGQRYSYAFTWLGRPLIQLPEDVLRIQEVVFRVRPDVIVETGVAHGGSLVLYATLCKALGCGRVVGVDIELRPHNRAALEEHPLASYITLVEGSSTDPAVVGRVRSKIVPGERVLVVLDSDHSRSHVLEELEAYAPLVSKGSYIVAADGIMADVAAVPGGHPDWAWDNPREAARIFAEHHPEFVLEDPARLFDESSAHVPLTYWPSGYLRRVGDPE
jgi:cephalosporin hydroxylase